MRKVKLATLTSLTKVYAAECAYSGLYKAVPVKADWAAICEHVKAQGGFATIPYAFRVGDMRDIWARAYDAAKRRNKADKPIAVAAKQPKRRTAKPKAQPKAAESITLTVTAEQRDLLVALLTQSA